MKRHYPHKKQILVLLALLALVIVGGFALELFIIMSPLRVAWDDSLTNSATPVATTNALSAALCVPQVGPSPTATPSNAWEEAQALFKRAQKELNPDKEPGEEYGAPLSNDGYKTLIQWNQEYKVEPSDAASFESLDMGLPCCSWAKPSRDEKTNCGCGHHQALEGLAKKLLHEGWTREAVQSEVTRWSHAFFPG